MADNETARERFSNAIVASLAGDQSETAIREFEAALSFGLTGENAVMAHILLGDEYSRISSQKELPFDQTINLPEWQRAEAEILEGLRVDREESCAYLSSHTGRALLRKFDLIVSVGGKARAEENLHGGIRYIEEMLGSCSYLPSPPLLNSLLTLGDLYLSDGNAAKARLCWETLIAAEPVDYTDEGGNETRVRRSAREKLGLPQDQEGEARAASGSGGCAILVVAAFLVASLVGAAVMTF